MSLLWLCTGSPPEGGIPGALSASVIHRVAHNPYQLQGAERLHEECFCAGIERSLAIFFLSHGGQHQYRDMGELRISVQPAQKFQAAHSGHHPVEHDDLRMLAMGERECFMAVRGKQHPAFGALQGGLHQSANAFFVVDDHDGAHLLLLRHMGGSLTTKFRGGGEKPIMTPNQNTLWN